MRQQTLPKGNHVSLTDKARSRKIHRVNLYMADELFAEVEKIASEKCFRSPSEVIQHALRIAMIAYKYERDPEHGLYWRDKENYSKILLV